MVSKVFQDTGVTGTVLIEDANGRLKSSSVAVIDEVAGKASVGGSEVLTTATAYTSAETDLLLDDKSDVGHTHTESDITDLDKYTQVETDTLLSGKADTVHTHVEADITDLDKYTQAEVDTLIAGVGGGLTDSVTTSDNTPTVLTTVPLDDNMPHIVEWFIKTLEISTGDSKWVSGISGFVKQGGVLTQISGDDIATGYTVGATSWAITLDTSSGDLDFQVTGENSKTINWYSNIEVK